MPKSTLRYATELGVICVVILIAGCATRPVNADKVTIVQGSSSFTASCKMLGPVSSSVNGWTFGSAQEAQQQAIWNMQAEAYERYGADTLSVQSMGMSMTEVGGHGIALKCYE